MIVQSRKETLVSVTRKADAKKPPVCLTLNRGGRPSLFHEEYVEEAQRLIQLGLTISEMAKWWGTTEITVCKWQKAHPEFGAVIKAGRIGPDTEVAVSLFKRATGYSHEAVKIFMTEEGPVKVPYIERYPPDPASMIFWLKNRRPDLWRDKIDVTSGGEKLAANVTIINNTVNALSITTAPADAAKAYQTLLVGQEEK